MARSRRRTSPRVRVYPWRIRFGRSRRRSTWPSSRTQPSVSFLQTPAWGAVKREWQARVARLVRHRRTSWSAPAWCCTGSCRGSRRYLAYLPEGPVIDWARRGHRRLARLRWPTTCRRQGAFGVRIGRAGGRPPLAQRHDQGRDRRRAGRPAQPGHARRGRPRRQPAAQPAPRTRAGDRRRTRTGSPPASPGSSSSCRSAGKTPGRAADRDEPAVAPQHQEGRQVRGQRQPGRRRRTCPSSTRCTSRPPSGTASRRGRWATSRPCSPPCRRRTRTGSGSIWPTTTATWSRPPPGSGSASTPGTRTAPAPPRSGRCAARTRPSGG